MALQNTRELSDVELLEIEMDVLWGSDAGPELVVACARDRARARISNRVRPELARSLAAEIGDRVPTGEDLGTPPPQLERWRVVLEDALGAAVRLAPTSGPSYPIEPRVSFRPTAELVRSDSADPAPLRAANPGHWGLMRGRTCLTAALDRGLWPGRASESFRSVIRQWKMPRLPTRVSGRIQSFAATVTQRL